MPKRHETSLRYVLSPDAELLRDILATLEAYGRSMRILDEYRGANLVQLHERAYQRVRDETGLPSRIVTLGLRDHSLRTRGEPVTSMPLDERVFSLKGHDTISLATLSGRHLVPYRVEGYTAGWTDFAAARLHAGPDGVEIRVGVDVSPSTKESAMVHEGILGRMGRIIAGAANAAVDGIENRNPIQVVEQAIRQIDEAADEARAALGRDQAEAHRVESRIKGMRRESQDIDGKIKTALDAGRDDLARAAVARQIDVEAQLDALDAALVDVKARIDEGSRGLAAVRAARRDAEIRLEGLRASLKATVPGAKAPDSVAGYDRARQAIDRVTGVVSVTQTGAAEMEEIDRLHRDRLIEERLARHKGGAPQ